MSKNNMKSPEEKEIIVKRYLNGESTTKLADEFNVSRRRIYYWVKDYEGKGLDGLILSGSNGKQGVVLKAGEFLSNYICKKHGRRYKSKTLDNLIFDIEEIT